MPPRHKNKIPEKESPGTTLGKRAFSRGEPKFYKDAMGNAHYIGEELGKKAISSRGWREIKYGEFSEAKNVQVKRQHFDEEFRKRFPGSGLPGASRRAPKGRIKKVRRM